MTAYEMRISDWSSDVCSSDLVLGIGGIFLRRRIDLITELRVAPNIFELAARTGVHRPVGKPGPALVRIDKIFPDPLDRTREEPLEPDRARFGYPAIFRGGRRPCFSPFFCSCSSVTHLPAPTRRLFF